MTLKKIYKKWACVALTGASMLGATIATANAQQVFRNTITGDELKIMEVAPNRLWFCYDRTPFSWDPTPPDGEERSRVYILTLEVERR